MILQIRQPAKTLPLQKRWGLLSHPNGLINFLNIRVKPTFIDPINVRGVPKETKSAL